MTGVLLRYQQHRPDDWRAVLRLILGGNLGEETAEIIPAPFSCWCWNCGSVNAFIIHTEIYDLMHHVHRLFFLLVLRSSWSCQPCRRVCCRILWGKWGSRSGRHKSHLWFPDTSDTRWWSLGVKSQTQPQWTKQDISFSGKKFNYLSCGWCSPCLPRIIWVLGPMTFLHCWTTKSNWWVNPSWVLRQNAIRLLTAWRLEKTLLNFKKLFPGVSLSTVSWHQCTQIWPILL